MQLLPLDSREASHQESIENSLHQPGTTDQFFDLFVASALMPWEDLDHWDGSEGNTSLRRFAFLSGHVGGAALRVQAGAAAPRAGPGHGVQQSVLETQEGKVALFGLGFAGTVVSSWTMPMPWSPVANGRQGLNPAPR